MRSDAIDSPGSITRRGVMPTRPRRPWLLIVAALLLALLSTVLWVKWEENRALAERLQAEIRQVYSETEALRTQVAQAQQRVAHLERQLRAGPPAQAPSAPRNTRTRQ